MYTVGLRQSGKVSGGLCGWEGEAGGCSHIASLSAHRTASRELFPANRCHHAASGVLLKVRHGGGREVVREVDGPSQLDPGRRLRRMRMRLRLQTVEMLHIRDTTWFCLGEIRSSAAGSTR